MATTTRKVRWGFLSTAWICNKNFYALQKSLTGEVVAVASRDLKKAQEWAQQKNIPKAYGSYDELIADPEIEAIYIPLPTGIRAQWAIKAANNKKHVLCDKPVGVSLKEVQDIIAACEKNNVQFMDGVMYMHHERFAAMNSVITNTKDFGEPKRATFDFSFPSDEKWLLNNIRTNKELEPMGALGDLGWYTIRFALWAFGYELPESVITIFHKDLNGVPLELDTILRFSNNRIATFHNSFKKAFTQFATVESLKARLFLDDQTLAKQEAIFSVETEAGISDNDTIVSSKIEKHVTKGCVQEVKMWETFNRLILQDIKDPFWPKVTLLTQTVLDACMKSGQSEGKPTIPQPIH